MTIALTMGIVFLWGVFAPRSQWRALSGWSVADPHAHEPGGAAYGVRRLASGVGVLGLVSVVLITTSSILTPPRAAPPPTDIEAMWGTPEPYLVDRVVHTIAEPPAGLTEVRVLGYQVLEEDEDTPEYFLRLQPFSLLGGHDFGGYIGAVAAEGFTAIGAADLVVHVRGPLLCIPRQAVVVETEESVRVGIFYGRPDPGSGLGVPATAAGPPDNATECPPDAPVTSSVLVPLDLAAPLGGRTVESLDGMDVQRVAVRR